MGAIPHKRRQDLLRAIEQNARKDSWFHEARERHLFLSPTVKEIHRMKGIAARARGNRALALLNASDYSNPRDYSRKIDTKEAASERTIERSANESVNKLKIKLRKPNRKPKK